MNGLGQLAAAPGPAAGPLGSVLHCDGGVIKPWAGYQLTDGANARILLRQAAFLNGEEIWKDGRSALLRWARGLRLGQEPDLVAAAAARRERAVARRTGTGRRRGQDVVHRRLLVTPEWRVVTGIGDRHNPHEIGIALHGTYGWPVIPGSTLKGAARAWARTEGKAREADLVMAFGGLDPETKKMKIGLVDVLDALPVGDPVRVRVDGVTPHVKPYYAEDSRKPADQRTPPAEWHNPEPSTFLVVSAGEFAVDLIGPKTWVDRAAAWCADACEDLGIGAKTGAGYGYLTVTDESGAPLVGQETVGLEAPA